MILTSNLAEKRPAMKWLKIDLRGRTSNRDGVGAIVRVSAGSQTYTKAQDGQSGYLSQSILPLYFGLGNAAHADKISVEWPSGKRQALEGPINLNRTLEIVEPAE